MATIAKQVLRNKRELPHYAAGRHGYENLFQIFHGTGEFHRVDGFYRVAYGDVYEHLMLKSSRVFYGEASVKIKK